MSKDFLELIHGLVIFILRSHVNFSQNDEEGDFKEKAETDVLFGHFLKTHVSTDDDTAKIGAESCESIDGGFEIFLMAAEIDHGDYFITIADDLFPIFIFILIESLGKDLFALFGKT